MARPTVSAFTEQVYARLPQTYRDEDEPLDFPLLRFLSLIGDQGGELEVLLDRIAYVPVDDGGTPGDTSDLVDPATADDAWLRWLAQPVGVVLPPAVTGVAARDAIAGAVNGFQVGTKGAIAAAAASALTGTRYVSVYDHSIATVGDGGIWDVMLVTRTSETPDITAVATAVTSKNAKPAGVVLHFVAYTATWTAMETTYGPAWSARNGRTWAQLQEAGL